MIFEEFLLGKRISIYSFFRVFLFHFLDKSPSCHIVYILKSRVGRMRIVPFSDIHNEQRGTKYIPEVPDADVCIVAGDMDEPIAASIEYLQETLGKRMEVIYVAGNHDHWNHTYRDNIKAAYAASDRCPNVHFLENEVIVIDGVRFIGATLWTDYRWKGKDPLFAKQNAERVIEDYKLIGWSDRPKTLIRADNLEQEHYRSRRFIQDALKVPFEGPTVVVTHHGPHPRSVFHWYEGDMLTAAYTSDLSEIIFKGAPALWVHGHTHRSFDYQVFDTRIVCNPVGYEGTENPDFNPNLVIDTADLLKTAPVKSYEELFGSL
jgi:Icc-related predicted phosphoesterase